MSNEIKCPHCGEAFTVDESGYAAILNQVRDQGVPTRGGRSRVFGREEPRAGGGAGGVEGRRGPARANRRARRRAACRPESPAVYQGERGGGGAQAGRERCDGRRGRAAARGGARARRAGPEAGEPAQQQAYYGNPDRRLAEGRGCGQGRPGGRRARAGRAARQSWSGQRDELGGAKGPVPRPSWPGLQAEAQAELAEKLAGERRAHRRPRARDRAHPGHEGAPVHEDARRVAWSSTARSSSTACAPRPSRAPTSRRTTRWCEGTKGDFVFRDFDEEGNEIVSIMFEMKNEADDCHPSQERGVSLQEAGRRPARRRAASTRCWCRCWSRTASCTTPASWTCPTATRRCTSSARSSSSPSSRCCATRRCSSHGVPAGAGSWCASRTSTCTNFEDQLAEFKDKFGRNYRAGQRASSRRPSRRSTRPSTTCRRSRRHLLGERDATCVWPTTRPRTSP